MRKSGKFNNKSIKYFGKRTTNHVKHSNGVNKEKG
jgi:hypothetical protein